MTERTRFLREQTVSGANKCMRRPLPKGWSVAELPYSIPEKKALSLKMLLDTMPLFIGKEEWIVGTRTFLNPNPGNEDGHDPVEYNFRCGVPYINQQEIEKFGQDQSWANISHYTPDFSILLDRGIDGIIEDARTRKTEAELSKQQQEFLSSVIIAYLGLKDLVNRYAAYAEELSEKEEGQEQCRLREIASVCHRISGRAPENFRDAVQLLWFGHLAAMVESFEFINYGRLDVILGKYLGNTPHDEAQQLIECLLLKMYDQADVHCYYWKTYSAQLIVTLGGVLRDGSNAVNDVTMMFLEAIDQIRLPDPEFNLRIHSENPPEFLARAAELTVSGCNHVSYYNDDQFIASLVRGGLQTEDAREYGFDLCQDINIPGKSVFYYAVAPNLAMYMMEFLKKNRHFETFDALLSAYKHFMSDVFRREMQAYRDAEEHVLQYRDGHCEEYFAGIRDKNLPVEWRGRSPMCPLPLLSGLYHGCLENAGDVVYGTYPIKEKGVLIGTVVETANSFAAIKKVVYDEKLCSLEDVLTACDENYQGKEQEILRSRLWNAPKWGNDDDYVDDIAKDLTEYCLRDLEQYQTFSGGHILGGIHQSHPVPTGAELMATPEGRFSGTPVAVTLTPESGTMKSGPTAALKSACKLDPFLIHWNFCVMVNYFASVFQGNNGEKTFRDLLKGYFKNGGLQHQPNLMDVEQLKKARQDPEKYKDLIVRLWGISAHFVELPQELQDELIARME